MNKRTGAVPTPPPPALPTQPVQPAVLRLSLTLLLLLTPTLPLYGQPATQPAAPGPLSAAPSSLAGKPVEEIRIIGRAKPLGTTLQSEILHRVRTREGQPFDPATVAEDYQRIFEMKRFTNVVPLVQPTETGVIVIFEITEQEQIREVRFRGNDKVDTVTLQNAVNLMPGEAIDDFRLGLAREAIQRVYQSKNYPYAHVEVDREELNRGGAVVFNITEGPRVRIRKVRILGNRTYSNNRVKDEIKTKAWFPFFGSGTYNPEQLEADVAAIRQFYESNGFFDARVGRKVVVSPNQDEVMVDFVIEEGPRYVVERVAFRGNDSIPDAELKRNLKQAEGQTYNADLVRRDIREIVKAYSPLGFIYMPQEQGPGTEDYLRIREERNFRREPGKVEVVYVISEGKPYRLGRVIVKGNEKTQDKVVLREIRVEPGQLYNSYEVQRAQERIRGTNLFDSVMITPIGEDPESRDLLVEVRESQTARFLIGAGVTSNSGVLGNISYEQRNFDIGNWPSGPDEAFSNRAFTGAGQTFRLQLEPGTELSRARVDFVEPWMFDQPYSFGVSGYLSQRLREDWAESRLGGRVSVGKRFNDVWSARVSLRGEDVEIGDIEDEAERAREILLLEGHSALDSVGFEIRRDTTNSPILPSQGTTTTAGWEHYGALFGDHDFDKFTVGWNWYTTVYEDLLDRRTILSVRADAGFITGDAPFFERFYGGGIGSVRGFRYRGISPRAGIDEDPVGGDFSLTGTVELNFPIAGDVLRGVLFTDAGTVERDIEINTIRVSAGFGFRLSLPFFGQVPIALDFGIPLVEDDQDDTRIFSFSLGLTQ